MTEIQAKKDLYNGGKCFTKGKKYLVSTVTCTPGLMEREATNDQGEPHIIGSWWREFRATKLNY